MLTVSAAHLAALAAGARQHLDGHAAEIARAALADGAALALEAVLAGLALVEHVHLVVCHALLGYQHLLAPVDHKVAALQRAQGVLYMPEIPSEASRGQLLTQSCQGCSTCRISSHGIDSQAQTAAMCAEMEGVLSQEVAHLVQWTLSQRSEVILILALQLAVL